MGSFRVQRVREWLREQGIQPVYFDPLIVVRQGGGVTVQVAQMDSRDLDWIHALERHLATDWGVPVTITEYPWPSAPVDRLKAVWTMTGGHFASLFAENQVQYGPEGFSVVFPSAVAETLFQKWGGLNRLRQLWPDLPPWQSRVDEPRPAVPEPAVAMESARKVLAPRLGRGAPEGEVVALNAVPAAGSVVVQGQIVNWEERPGRDGLRHFKAVLTDGQGALRVRFSDRRKEPPVDTSWIKPGIWLKAAGTLEEDKFSQERVLRVRDAGPVDNPETIVDGGQDRRIELHVHTKMSAMDGLIDVRDVFDLAQRLGHPAVAVVDHAVLQTYPEVQSLALKTGVKAIYGVEVNVVEDRIAPLTGGPALADWPHTPIVVVDVETTGLSPRAHQVIEIGAAKVVDGQIVDTFHRLVRPLRSISQATRDITGITPDELVDAPQGPEVFRDFFRFAQGAVLAAHNARFDMGFLRSAYAKWIGEVFPYAVLDSLPLARIVLPGLKSYGLGPLSEHLKIPLSRHHRALADAEATAHLIVRLLETAADRDGGPWDEDRLRDPHPLSFTVGRPTPVTILVRSQAGLTNLYRLISASHLEYFHRVPRVPRHLIEQNRDGWLVGSPAHGGEIQEALLRGASPDELEAIAKFYDYWEVAPPDAYRMLAAEEHLDGPAGVQAFIEDLIALGALHAKPVAAVSDAHYLRPRDHIFREILATTAKGELHDAEEALHFRTSQEMEEAFGWLPEPQRRHVVYQAPQDIARRIETVRPVPEGLFAPKLPEAEAVVSQMPWERARELYGDPLDPIIQARLDKEIHSIVHNGFASIYYIAHRLVKKSLDDGYLVGSRGSVGSSLVATLLNITEVNPLPPHYRCPACRYTEFVSDERIGSGFDLPEKQCPRCRKEMVGDGQDIPFETFLGFEGDKVPDIDLNFSGDYQSDIHRYTEELFGQGKVFRAGTIATVADKTAYGLVRAWARDRGRELTPAEVEWLASGITGVKRTTGQHPGGLMVVPQDEDIHHFCPVQHPADDRTSEVVTTHFDYHAIEGRLLKLDLLGHDDPTAIRMLEDLTGISAQSVPFQDPDTMSLFRSVRILGVRADDIGTPVGSLGIPEFGTRFVRGMLIDTQPQTFAELIRISGLSHGTEVWTNNAQELIRQKVANLSEVIATRDDIMIYLINRGLAPKTAFAISESVRKGKGVNAEHEQVMKDHGVPGWYIDSCRKISYLFPKAHAAAYVMMGWRIAWFKVHHPLAYYATYFSVRASDFDPDIVLGGMKRINQALADIDEKGNDASPKEKGLVTVLEIAREMLARRFRFYPVNLERSDATRFQIQDDGLLMPFAALPGLGTTAAQNIIAARQTAPFLSVHDLRTRARLSKSIIDLLRAHGALKGLGETSQLAFF